MHKYTKRWRSIDAAPGTLRVRLMYLTYTIKVAPGKGEQAKTGRGEINEANQTNRDGKGCRLSS
ncbi:hypothetical protein [Syntrophomonas wolfei]|uniref:hypothetical protein n=1 Tax=Syntrophomonas wolfei TaxID=863 RepID=UPI00059DF3FE|nr:hypothetical protein [Syntrophomonas wolfei]